MNSQKIPLKNSLLLLLTATVWGIAFVAQSVGMDHIGPFTFTAVRSIIGSIVLLPVIWFLDRKNDSASSQTGTADKISEKSGSIGNRGTTAFVNSNAADTVGSTSASAGTRRDLLLGGFCCGAFLCAASNFQQIGIQYTSVGKAGFITACYIVLVPIFGLFLKKKCSPFIWISVIMAVIGLYLLCITDGFSIGKGDILVLICAVLFAGHILVIDYFSPKTDGVKMSCLQFLVCGLLSLIPALLFEKPQISGILAAWKPILYAGAMSSGVGYTLQIIGQKGMNPTVASLILSLESCISVLAGWIILGQHLSLREILGCIIMFAAILLAQMPQKEV